MPILVTVGSGGLLVRGGGCWFSSPVLVDGADKKGGGGQNHDEYGRGLPPFRQLLGEKDCTYPGNDRGPEYVAGSRGHLHSLARATVPT